MFPRLETGLVHDLRGAPASASPGTTVRPLTTPLYSHPHSSPITPRPKVPGWFAALRTRSSMPPILMGLDSDDEDDALPPAPPTVSSSQADEMAQSFMLSQSGSFHTDDFKVNRGGLTASAKHHSPETASAQAARTTAGGSVSSIADLETLNELGAGASGTVFRARHRKTGEILAVKQVTILDKPKRDQVVTELKMLMSHNGCPWIVSLYNAFYEEAKVYTVLEFMDAGSVADLVEKHKDVGMRDERELSKIGLQMLNGLNYLHKTMHQVRGPPLPPTGLPARPLQRGGSARACGGGWHRRW